MRGWRNYRIEYFTPNGIYQDKECSVWLPSSFDVRSLEHSLNKTISKQVESFRDSLTKRKASIEALIDKATPPDWYKGTEKEYIEVYQGILREIEEDIANFEEHYSIDEENLP
jgi:hypothetical protein